MQEINKKAFHLPGFSIIELTAVLVIIAFISVLATSGSSLMQAASLRKVMQEREIYNTAIVSFKQTYQAEPGDMSNATSFFSGVSNGNGNGIVLIGTAEQYYVWQHLNAAGFIAGYYDGSTLKPASQLAPMHWDYMANSANLYSFSATTTNALYFDVDCNAGTWKGAGMTPPRAQTLDLKIDDGNATTGNMLAWSAGLDCIRATNGTGAIQNYAYAGTDGNYTTISGTGYDTCYITFLITVK